MLFLPKDYLNRVLTLFHLQDSAMHRGTVSYNNTGEWNCMAYWPIKFRNCWNDTPTFCAVRAVPKIACIPRWGGVLFMTAVIEVYCSPQRSHLTGIISPWMLRKPLETCHKHCTYPSAVSNTVRSLIATVLLLIQSCRQSSVAACIMLAAPVRISV